MFIIDVLWWAALIAWFISFARVLIVMRRIRAISRQTRKQSDRLTDKIEELLTVPMTPYQLETHKMNFELELSAHGAAIDQWSEENKLLAHRNKQSLIWLFIMWAAVLTNIVWG